MTATLSASSTRPEYASSHNEQKSDERYLFGPVLDFLLLGGATLILLPVFFLLPTRLLDGAQVLAWTTIIAHAVNNPHFAHSYQLFYRGFVYKSFSNRYPREWRARYWAAGIAAPLLLVGFFVLCILCDAPHLLGYAVNLMFFTVGWHYTKQGYGMLMLDAALKRRYFSEAEKKSLLRHAYAVWILSWMLANEAFAKSQYWGIEYFTFYIPAEFRYIAWAAVTATGGRVAFDLTRRITTGGRLPINGLVAYAASGYIWLLFAQPIFVLIIPALHSLQYLVVVWRYEINVQTHRIHIEEGGCQDEPANAAPFSLGLRMAIFYAVAIAAGYFGFWFFPRTVGDWLPDTLRNFGGGLFLYCAWVFINVHHYCMDSVMWRKGNPDTGRYLFG